VAALMLYIGAGGEG